MKKATLLVAAVLCSLGSFAQSSIQQLPTEISKTTYQLVTPRGTLYYDKTIEESYITSNCMTGRNQNDEIRLEDERGQFLVIPADSENNTFYLYSVEAKKFVYHEGQYKAGLSEDPTEIAMWAHGATEGGSQAYNHTSFSYADYPFTIADSYVEGVTVAEGKHLNSINVCCWDTPANPDYRWCDTSHLDDGNAFAFVVAGEVSDVVYNEVREALGLAPEVVEPEVPTYNTTTKYFTAPELRAEADATGKALIAIHNVTSTGNKYITGLQTGDKVSEDGTLAGARAPYESEVLEMIPAEGGYILRQAGAEEGEGYIGLNGNNFTVSVAGNATVWTVLGPGEEGYGNVSGFDDIYTDIEKTLNDNMVRFIVNGNQYMNGQGYGNLGGVRGGTGAWSFNYIYNVNYTEGGEVIDPVDPVDPVDPEPPVVEPEELTWSPVSSGNTYAIVNLQPTDTDYYLNYVDGNLSTIDATECNSLYEWPETAKFQAIELADGRFAFKNIGTGNYLAWKGTANRNNTTGAYNNCGYNPEINEMSSWTMNESTRFEGAYWFRAEQRNELPNDGANLTGTFVIGNDGAWNAWTDGECTMATFSNTFGFVLLEEGEAPEPPIVEPTFDYAAAVAPVLAEANEVLEGHDNVLVTTVSDKLITRNDQFSSPHSDRAEGSTNNLLDGAANTFWHSDWHAGNQPAHSHYLQVALDEAIEGDVILTFVRRNAANDQVTLLDVETSMDGENFAHAAYIDMPNSGAGQTEQKVFALEEKAKFLRFWADATTTNRGYWHVGDFQLQTTKTELDIDAPDYAYPTAVAELQAAIAAAQAVENGTQADVDALAAAVAAYKAALAGYPEFTEWTGEMEVVTGEVSNIDDLLNVCVKFNRAATLAQSEIGVLGAIFDETGDVYALAFDQLCGGVDCEAVKSEGFVGHVANVHFDKIDDLTFGLQSSAKALAAKIGGFAPEAGVAHVVLASNSFIVDGEKLTEFKKVTFNIAAGSITSVETVVLNSKGEIFDLQGRRASQAQNGLFIQNGKKVIK